MKPNYNEPQALRVLERLEVAPLTPMQAFSELGVYRVAAVVHRLRQMGYPIVSESIEVQTRNGSARTVRYCVQPKPWGAQ